MLNQLKKEFNAFPSAIINFLLMIAMLQIVIGRSDIVQDAIKTLAALPLLVIVALPIAAFIHPLTKKKKETKNE